MPLIQIAVIEGQPVDLTLRIGQPHTAPVQLQQPLLTRTAAVIEDQF